MKKQVKAIVFSAASVGVLLICVLVFFSCSVGPDPEVEEDENVYRNLVQSSSWSLKDGRKLVSQGVPYYLRNVSSVEFGALDGDRVSCTIKDGTAEYSLCYLEFSSYDSGSLYVYDYSAGSYVKLQVKFSESNMRLRYSDSDYADFKQD